MSHGRHSGIQGTYDDADDGGRSRPDGRGGRGDHGGPGDHGQPGGRGGGLKDTAARYALLPLRLFLGVTFVYAGLDKLTDSAFLSASGPESIGEIMRGLRDSSAVPGLIDFALKEPVGFGYAIAIGELAVGIGTLLGFLARLAALGGALISLSLWLTWSWSSDPYYYGNDLPYLIGWVTLLLAGASVFSVDAWLRLRRRTR